MCYDFSFHRESCNENWFRSTTLCSSLKDLVRITRIFKEWVWEVITGDSIYFPAHAYPHAHARTRTHPIVAVRSIAIDSRTQFIPPTHFDKRKFRICCWKFRSHLKLHLLAEAKMYWRTRESFDTTVGRKLWERPCTDRTTQPTLSLLEPGQHTHTFRKKIINNLWNSKFFAWA